MKFRLLKLELRAKQKTELIELVDFNYFYGRMGAGKSSIPRLIDYCFGGQLEMTPALQSEFVSCSLKLLIEGVPLEIERMKGSHQVRAVFGNDGATEVILPIKTASGEVLPGTNVEILSDLIFFLAKVTPPKVRRSKIKEDSAIERLSFRDLFWYCYLSQEELDSNFFHLDSEANPFKRLKSRDVLRYIVGYHQERVTEVESALEEVRVNRLSLQNSVKALTDAMESTGLQTEEQVTQRKKRLERELEEINRKIEEARQSSEKLKEDVDDSIRQRALAVSLELEAVENSIVDVETAIHDHDRHLNEIIGLKFKFKRVTSARAVLEGLEFDWCPRCTQKLPNRAEVECRVCGQPDLEIVDSTEESEIIEKDADARIKELREIIKLQKSKLSELRARQSYLQQSKGAIDAEYGNSMEHYDSVYLSQALSLERRKAGLLSSIKDLNKWKIIPQTIAFQSKEADNLQLEEISLRRLLKDLRSGAEKDLGNLHRLEYLFKDCLLRTKLPSYSERDTVTIRPPSLLPQVFSPETGDMLVASFSNLGSGGKKTLFKCCFALAVHLLATEIGAALPEIIIIDSPMKNISERENPEQFAGFYQLLFSLAEGELAGTQFIIVDNELYPPPAEVQFDFRSRHMVPYEEGRTPRPDELPLISYYKGH